MKDSKEFNTDDLKHLTKNLQKVNKMVGKTTFIVKILYPIIGLIVILWIIALILSPVLIDIGLIKYLFF